MLIEDQVQSWLLAKQLARDERVTKNAGGILAAWTAFCTSSLISYYFSPMERQPQISDGQSEWSKTDVDTLWYRMHIDFECPSLIGNAPENPIPLWVGMNGANVPPCTD